MRNVTAYTENYHPYPAYVSVNEAAPKDGKQMASITVRSREFGGAKQAVIELPRADLLRLAHEIIEKA